MIGDIICIGREHIKKADIIIPEIINRYKYRIIVCIAGISGTGKTEIASVMQDKLFYNHNLKSKIIHIDDYYKSDFHSRNRKRKETGIIGKEEISWGRLCKVVKDFRDRKKNLYVRRIHRYLDSIEYSISPNRKIDILIIEGLYSLYLNNKDFGIYLEGNIEDTYSFRKFRNKENPDDEFRKSVLQKEEESVLKSKKNADFIVQWEV